MGLIKEKKEIKQSGTIIIYHFYTLVRKGIVPEQHNDLQVTHIGDLPQYRDPEGPSLRLVTGSKHIL